jgi:hypothetical protein
MKLKDLTPVWSNRNNFAVLDLPFITYLVEPDWANDIITSNKKYVASFKGSILVHEAIINDFTSIEEAKMACEAHLGKILKLIFQKLFKVVDLESITEFYQLLNTCKV